MHRPDVVRRTPGDRSPGDPPRSSSETRLQAVERRRLLIVEDQAMLGRLFRDMAAEICDASLARDAHEALARIEAAPVDVVLADENLGASPRGTWLLAQIAERWPHVRRCLMSGAEHHPARDEYVFYFKPLSLEDLRSVVLGDHAPALDVPRRRAL